MLKAKEALTLGVVDAAFAASVGPGRQVAPPPRVGQDRQQPRDKGQRQRGRQGVGQQAHDRRAAHEAAAEVAHHDAAHELGVLHEEGTVQTQTLADVLQVLLGHAAGALAEHQRRVARQAHRVRHQQGHHQHDEDRLQQPLDQELGHALIRPSMCSRISRRSRRRSGSGRPTAGPGSWRACSGHRSCSGCRAASQAPGRRRSG